MKSHHKIEFTLLFMQIAWKLWQYSASLKSTSQEKWIWDSSAIKILISSNFKQVCWKLMGDIFLRCAKFRMQIMLISCLTSYFKVQKVLNSQNLFCPWKQTLTGNDLAKSGPIECIKSLQIRLKGIKTNTIMSTGKFS